MSRSRRHRVLALVFTALASRSSSCAELEQARGMNEHADENDRVERVGGDVLVDAHPADMPLFRRSAKHDHE